MSTYNKEQYLRQQEETFKKLSAVIENTAKEYRENPELIADLLKFRSQFYQYSYNNTVLIRSQNQGAMFTASFAKYKEMGYQVKKGEKGLKIFVPVTVTYLYDPVSQKWTQLKYATEEQKAKAKSGELETKKTTKFKIGSVFDISQTNCPKEDYPKILHMGYQSEHHAEIYHSIKHYCENELGCPVKMEDIRSIDLRGYFNPSRNEITLNEKLEDTERLSTLVHEMGHAILHANIELRKIPTAQKEFEADALAIMFENYFGIDITNLRVKHLADNYQKMIVNLDEQQISIETVLQKVFDHYTTQIKTLEYYIDKELNPQIKDLGNRKLGQFMEQIRKEGGEVKYLSLDIQTYCNSDLSSIPHCGYTKDTRAYIAIDKKSIGQLELVLNRHTREIDNETIWLRHK